jgi:hypothetical protein
MPLSDGGISSNGESSRVSYHAASPYSSCRFHHWYGGVRG